jgi:hypothetical protein
MKKFKGSAITRLTIACCLFLALGLSGFARINNNGAGDGYTTPDGTFSKTISIEAYITAGAGFYLSANTDIQALLDMVEMQDSQGLDFNQLARLVDSAAAHMKNAEDTYRKLIEIAEVTPYSEDVQAALKKFDYNGFMLANGLNAATFGNVEKYLESGDITGTLKKTYSDFKIISGLLNLIRGEIFATRLPGLEIFWRLNETCAEASLFGSYITRVFFALR